MDVVQRKNEKERIVIIGMACRFPGAADYKEYWTNLVDGKNSIQEIPPERWNTSIYYDKDIKTPNTSMSKWCGLVDDIDKFDNRFFSISDREARSMDPQQRILLQEVWHCMEDSNLSLEELQSRKTAVYVGAMAVDYRQEAMKDGNITDSFACLGGYENMLANRISYFYDLHGNSVSVNAACASSLIALSDAQHALERGECEYAIIAGVNMNTHPWKYISFSKSRMLSPTGQCRTFDYAADGYVPGDGIGVLLVTKEKTALENNSHIYGIVRGSSSNHGGRAKSITSPNIEAQKSVILGACEEADVNPESITYVEAHGTGTSLGDPIEVEALSQAYHVYTDKKQFCYIGSVKANIGHLEAAAGIASVIKVLLMMKHKEIPPQINITKENPIIDFVNSPFQVAKQKKAWEKSDDVKSRFAGVSSFGFGGANCHMILEEYIPETKEDTFQAWDSAIVALSAKSQESLVSSARQWLAYIDNCHDKQLKLAYISQLLCRENFELRKSAVVRNKDEWKKFLEKVIDEPARKREYSKKILFIPQCEWENIIQSDRLCNSLMLSSSKVTKLIKAELGSSYSNLIEQYISKNILESERKVAGFVLHYFILHLIIKCGYQPDIIYANGNGYIMAMVINHMLTLENAVNIIKNPESIRKYQLDIPDIPYYDSCEKRIISKIQVKKNYISFLSDSLKQLQMEELRQIETAKKLIQYQHTFINYMGEWDSVFLTITGEKTADILLEDEKLSRLTKQQKTLLIMAIVYSLSRVYLKWSIREDKQKNPQVINEVCDLLYDHVITIEQVSNLLSEDENKLENCYQSIKENKERIHLQRGYEILKNCMELEESTNLETLIQDRTQIGEENTVTIKDKKLIFTCGSNVELQEALTELWENGIDVDWEVFYPRKEQNLCDIPQYSFSGKRFWIYDREKDVENKPHNKISITNMQPDVREHVIHGNVLVPAAAIILAFRDAFNLTNSKMKVQELILQRPLDFSTGDSYDLTILSKDTHQLMNGTDVIASWKFSNAEEKVEKEKYLISENRKACKTEIYNLLKRAKYDYGKMFQILSSYEHSNQMWFFSIDKTFANETTILDAVFQAVLFAVYKQNRIDISQYQNIPYYCKSIVLNGDLRKTDIILLQDDEIFVKGNDIYASMKGLNAEGEVIISVHNMVLKHVKMDEKQNSSNMHSEAPILYHEGWKQEKLSNGAGSYREKTAVILQEKDTEALKFKDELGAYYSQTHSISLAEMSEKECLDGLKSVMENQERQEAGIDFYLYLENEKENNKDADNTYLHFLRKVKEVFNVTKALSKIRYSGNKRILVVTQCHGDSRYQIENCGVAGFLRSAVKELAKTEFKYVSILNDLPLKELVQCCVNECDAISDSQMIQYQNGIRYIEAYVRYVPEQNEKREGFERGTYIITGGAGKLGLKMAGCLLDKGAGTIVLLGRSEQSEENVQKIKTMKNDFGHVVYYSCDITDRNQLKEVMLHIKKEHGSINGIVHAAGVLKDGLLSGKTQDSMDSVLRPKVYGAMLLDELTQNEPLSFFIMFSSIVSCIGNAGQTDYCAANYFLDCFSEYRSRTNASGESLAVNWSLWEDGGMGLTEQHKNYFAGKAGLLSGNNAVFSILDALGTSKKRIAVVSNREGFEKIINNQLCDEVDDQRMKNTNKDAILEEVVTILSNILEVPVSEISSETDLREFGMESILITELSEKLNDKYGLSLDGTFFFECNTVSGLSDYIAAHTNRNFADVESEVPTESDSSKKEQMISKKLIAILAGILEMNETDLDSDTDLREFGMESILLNEFCSQIQECLGVEINPSVLFEYADIESIASYLEERYPDRWGDINSSMSVSKEEAVSSEEIKAVEETDIKDDDIVIVGLSGRFPMAEDSYEYWNRLLSNENMITEVPKSRWDARILEQRAKNKGRGTKVKWGGFLKEVDKFDSEFFKISRREAELMDPQQRMMLEESWNALEDAGIVPSKITGTKTGVYVGVSNTDYNDLMVKYDIPFDSYTSTGSFFSIIPNRISYFFDLKGPSLAIDTACSSSLVAVHEAVKAIRLGECNMALAGGVNTILLERKHVSFSDAGMLCEDGQCKTFDKSANGYVRGEGAGMVVLKRYQDAVRDNNPIYAVIKGSAVNHGGFVGSITRPNPVAQSEVIRDSYLQAEFKPEMIDYIEVHGTGTNLGDPIEINGLKKAFKELNEYYGECEETHTCALGSVKTNIGHLESAAGIAGLIKILKAMKAGMIPGTRNVVEENPMIQLEDSPFYIVKENQEWKNRICNGMIQPKRAGISSFGFGGVNAHIALEEAKNPNQEKTVDKIKHVVVLSAKSEESLRNTAGKVKDFLNGCRENKDYLRCLYTLQAGREHFEERLAFKADDAAEAVAILEKYLNYNPLDKIRTGTVRKKIVNKNEYSKEKLENSSAEKLAEMYVLGELNEWKELYPDIQLPFLPMPGYQFKKEKYWLPVTKDAFEVQVNEEIGNVDFSKVLFYKKNYEKLEYDNALVSSRKWYVICTNHSLLQELKKQDFAGLNIEFLSEIKAITDKEKEKSGVLLVEDVRNIEDKNGSPDYIKELFVLSKELQKHNKGKGILKVFILQNSEEANPAAASINAFLRSLREEPVPFSIESIEYRERSDISLISQCLTKCMLYAADYYPNVVFQKGEWQKEVFTSEEPDFETKEMNYIRPNGVYLITGGTGRIGSSIAQTLLNKEKCTIILCGRKESISNELKEKLDKANLNGSTIVYRSVELIQRNQVEEMISEINRTYKKLDGIYYCAGIIRDGLLRTKTWEDFRLVFETKVQGIINLADTVSDLDFFFISSSYIADRGNAGQTDYSSANAYMDAWVEKRNEELKKVGKKEVFTSINWPLWDNTTMDSSKDTDFSQLKAMGLEPMPEETGIEILHWALAHDMHRLSFGYGDKEKLLSGFHKKFEYQKRCEDNSNVLESGSEDYRNVLENYIKRCFSELTKIESEKIDSSVDFGDYGLDSMMVKEMNQKLEAVFPGVSKTILYEKNNIDELTGYLLEHNFSDIERTFEVKTNEIGKEESMMHESEDIAIIAMSGRYPQADNMEQFWNNLKNGVDCVTEIPADRWDVEKYYSKDSSDRGKMYCKWGAFVNDVDKFDALFFNISPKEAEMMDPQERLFLESTYELMENAGYTKEMLTKMANGEKSVNIGVFAGVTTNTYSLWGADYMNGGMKGIPNSFEWSLANRVSYFWNFCGPSIPVDTACSSSLTAVHLACESLKRKECEMAIVGGVNLYLHPLKYTYLCSLNMLSPTGKCHSFGQDADGFVPGEGCGAILLKPLRKAEEDGDKILAVIKGTAVNHGGATSGYTVPNPEAQTKVILSAMKQANVDANTISYIETHGTGTELGDPIEVNALCHAFEKYKVGTKHCAIGSLKSNIGHLEAASGVASICKVVMQMQNKMLVPSLHAEVENRNIDFAKTPFYVQKEQSNWKQLVSEEGNAIPRRAGISAFGAGGANAHIIVEEYEERKQIVPVCEDAQYIFILSAKNRDRLVDYAERIIEYIEKEQFHMTAGDLAYTLSQCRNEMEERIAVVAGSVLEYKEKLQQFISGIENAEGVFTGKCKKQYLTRYTLENVDSLALENLTKEELAHAWCEGEKVDWEQIYPRESHYMLMLPNYPFEKKRCWFDMGITTSVMSSEPMKKNYNKEAVQVEVSEHGIAIVKMEDRKNRNMFSDDIHQGLIDAFTRINQTENVKCVIVTGYENVFCMGGTKEQLDNISRQTAKCSDTAFAYKGFLQCKVPVIAAIQGHAMGGGLVMGLFADIVVMSRESVYSINFTQFGFTPGVGATYILREKLGFNLANEMMYTAQSYTGADLENRGVGFKFTDSSSVLREAVKIAESVQKKPNITLTTLKAELAGRELKKVPQIVESEVRMHEHVFQNFDASANIDKYFGEAEMASEEKKDIQKGEMKYQVHVNEPEDKPEKKEAIYQSFQESRIDKNKVEMKTQKVPLNVSQQKEKQKRVADIRRRIMKILCDLLHVTEAEANGAEDFKDLGVDSISGVEIIRDINKEFQTAIDVVVIYDYCNLDSLSEFIYMELASEDTEMETEPDSKEEQYLLSLFESVKNNSLGVDAAEKLLEGMCYDK